MRIAYGVTVDDDDGASESDDPFKYLRNLNSILHVV